jgi:hypothetical protein
MRTGFSVLFFLAAMTATAAAHSSLLSAVPGPLLRAPAIERASTHLDLSTSDSFLYRHMRSDDAVGLRLANEHASAPPAGLSGPSINIGSFHAEIGGTGTKAHLAHYTLEGVQVMGGTVSGSIDGRSARIAIDW